MGLGEKSVKMSGGEHLNDADWHSLAFRRRGMSITVAVDEYRPIVGKQSKKIK